MWNIRGASRRDSLRHLSQICAENNVRFLVLIEPMSDVPQLLNVRQELRFDKAETFVDGQIWCFWFNELSVTFQEYADQMVHTRISFTSGEFVYFTAVYAKCTRVGRRRVP